MADTTHKLVGQNYTPPDLVAKVTGQAKCAEDFRAEGMLFTKLLLSPMPHARVRNIDATAALAMPGVHAILTEEDCPNPGRAMLGEGVVISDEQNIEPEMILTNEPRYQGEPILAVAADSEELAAEAIERIVVDLEPLPFVVDPIEALRPGSPNPRTEGNVWVGNHVEEIKWTAEDWQEIDITRMSVLEPGDLLTAIRIPATWAGAQFYFEKVRDREVWDFPLVNVASALRSAGDRIEQMRLVVGAVAARPQRLVAVEAAVAGQPRTEATAELAAGRWPLWGRSRCSTTATRCR